MVFVLYDAQISNEDYKYNQFVIMLFNIQTLQEPHQFSLKVKQRNVDGMLPTGSIINNKEI